MNEKTVKRMANTCNNYYSCALCPYNPEDISRFIGDKWIGGCPNYDRKLVYAMSKGYRKVPDGAVVLLIGENNQALDEKTIEYFVKHNEQIRKETAERDFCTIIKALEERKERVKAFYGVAESAGVDIAIRTVKELAKQFGVEIKEYEK